MAQPSEASTPYSWPALGAARAAGAVVPAAGGQASALPSADPSTVLPEERRAAREQGYAEGLRQGQEEARVAQAAVLAEIRASAQQFLDELGAEKARARDLLRWLLQTLAEELSVQQLNRSPELLDRLLDEAVSDVGLPSEGLTVGIAPGLEAWWQENEFRDDVSVQIDDRLAPGMVQLRGATRVAEFDPRALVNRLLNAAPQELPGEQRGEAARSEVAEEPAEPAADRLRDPDPGPATPVDGGNTVDSDSDEARP